MSRSIALASLATVGLTLSPTPPAQASPPPYPHYHVQFRSPIWLERTFDSPARAHHFADLKRSEGFEVHVAHHGYHFHVRYRSFDWRTYRTVHSHAYAHELADMLRSRGYQARVTPF